MGSPCWGAPQQGLMATNSSKFPDIRLQYRKTMAYHAENSSDFVGLRTILGGRRQVVYDANGSQRVILEICDPTAPEAKIDEALKEGIDTQNVLRGVISALQARNIPIDITS